MPEFAAHTVEASAVIIVALADEIKTARPAVEKAVAMEPSAMLMDVVAVALDSTAGGGNGGRAVEAIETRW